MCASIKSAELPKRISKHISQNWVRLVGKILIPIPRVCSKYESLLTLIQCKIQKMLETNELDQLPYMFHVISLRAPVGVSASNILIRACSISASVFRMHIRINTPYPYPYPYLYPYSVAASVSTFHIRIHVCIHINMYLYICLYGDSLLIPLRAPVGLGPPYEIWHLSTSKSPM